MKTQAEFSACVFSSNTASEVSAPLDGHALQPPHRIRLTRTASTSNGGLACGGGLRLKLSQTNAMAAAALAPERGLTEAHVVVAWRACVRGATFTHPRAVLRS